MGVAQTHNEDIACGVAHCLLLGCLIALGHRKPLVNAMVPTSVSAAAPALPIFDMARRQFLSRRSNPLASALQGVLDRLQQVDMFFDLCAGHLGYVETSAVLPAT
jgi:hypothetical protein